MTDGYLGDEHTDGRQFDGDEAKTGAKTQSQTIKQEDANERLTDVTSQCHTSWCTKRCQPRAVGLEEQTNTCDIAESQRDNTHGIE
jgi:hypothetical protein